MTYKREKYTFINANIRVINIILKIIRDNRQTNAIHEHFYDTVCNSIAFLDSFRMDKTNINALVQSIERSLHLIHYSQLNNTNSLPPPQIGLYQMFSSAAAGVMKTVSVFW